MKIISRRVRRLIDLFRRLDTGHLLNQFGYWSTPALYLMNGPAPIVDDPYRRVRISRNFEVNLDGVWVAEGPSD